MCCYCHRRPGFTLQISELAATLPHTFQPFICNFSSNALLSDEIIIFSYLCAIFRSKGGETSEKTGCATYRITDEFVLHSYDRYGSSCCLRVHNALLL